MKREFDFIPLAEAFFEERAIDDTQHEGLLEHFNATYKEIIEQVDTFHEKWMEHFNVINKIEMELDELLGKKDTMSVIDYRLMKNKILHARTIEKNIPYFTDYYDYSRLKEFGGQRCYAINLALFNTHLKFMMLALESIEVIFNEVEIRLQTNVQHDSVSEYQSFMPSIHSFARTTADYMGTMMNEDIHYSFDLINKIVKITSETLAETLYAAEKESVSVRMLDAQRANFLSVLQENERLKHSAHGVVEKKAPSVDMLSSSLHTLVEVNKRLQDENAVLKDENKKLMSSQNNSGGQQKTGTFFQNQDRMSDVRSLKSSTEKLPTDFSEMHLSTV